MQNVPTASSTMCHRLAKVIQYVGVIAALAKQRDSAATQSLTPKSYIIDENGKGTALGLLIRECEVPIANPTKGPVTFQKK